MTAREEQMERIKQILKSHDIEMVVGGCGCCGSPWATFSYKGEEIFDSDEFNLDTSK